MVGDWRGECWVDQGGEITYSTWHVRGEDVAGGAALVVRVAVIVPTH